MALLNGSVLLSRLTDVIEATQVFTTIQESFNRLVHINAPD